MGNFNLQVYDVSLLPATSVTVYQKQATIVRTIPLDTLRPGLNIITINGLSNSTEPDSVKIEGGNTPRNTLITDVTVEASACPDMRIDPWLSEDEESSDDEYVTSLFPPELKAAQQEEDKAIREIAVCDISKKSIASQLSALEAALEDHKPGENMAEKLQSFDAEYVRLKTAEMDLEPKRENWCRKKTRLARERKRLTREFYAEHEKLLMARKKDMVERQMREKKRRWDKSVGCESDRTQVSVLIERQTLPEGTDETALTIQSGLPPTQELDDTPNGPYLRLSYVVEGDIKWTPHSTLTLDSTNNTGILTYNAQYFNRSGESFISTALTISSTQNTLSTSHLPPSLFPRHLTLQKPSTGNKRRAASSLEKGLGKGGAKRHRKILADPPPIPMLYADSDSLSARGDSITLPAHAPEDVGVGKLSQAASKAAEYGRTTTHTLPGRRNFLSTSETSRHVLAEFPVTARFEYKVVPRKSNDVFMKSSIVNTSSMLLLEARAGLTLDGTFMGNTKLPQCAPGGTVEVGLGVDKGIRCIVPRDVEKVATQGFLGGWTVMHVQRKVQIVNDKAATVCVRVLEQVPVSVEERLKIVVGKVGVEEEVGLVGVEVAEDGLVNFDVEVEAGGERWCVLEYEMSFPGSEEVVEKSEANSEGK